MYVPQLEFGSSSTARPTRPGLSGSPLRSNTRTEAGCTTASPLASGSAWGAASGSASGPATGPATGAEPGAAATGPVPVGPVTVIRGPEVGVMPSIEPTWMAT